VRREAKSGGHDPRAIDASLGGLERAVGFALEGAVREGWLAYAALVERWRARTDLVAARDAPSLVEVLFADALASLAGAFFDGDGRFVDVGAGVGAPTLPLLVALPRWRAVLVEPRRKRVAFLRTAVGSLGLAERACVVEDRLALDDPVVEGKPFGVAVSRATFAPAEWLRVGARLARRTLVLTAREEPPAAPQGLRAGSTLRYAHPSTGAPRAISSYDRDGDASSSHSPG
jgi:16S rRNA (guanine527-N7)-methyltransferase